MSLPVGVLGSGVIGSGVTESSRFLIASRSFLRFLCFVWLRHLVCVTFFVSLYDSCARWHGYYSSCWYLSFATVVLYLDPACEVGEVCLDTCFWIGFACIAY